MKKFILLIAGLLMCLSVAIGQNEHKLLRKGDSAYLNQDFTSAEENYRKAIEQKRDNPQGSYNLGNAIYNQERFEEAAKHFENAAAQATDPTQKSNAYYNLGNTYFKAQDFEKSIESYVKSLETNPEDPDTQHNLNLARQMKELQQQQQQQQQQQGEEGEENEDQEKQEQQEQQEPQDGEQQEPQDSTKQEQEPQDQEGEQDEDQQPQEGEEGEKDNGEEKDLNKEEARQLLQIMDDEERKVQEKMRKAQGQKGKKEKDW